MTKYSFSGKSFDKEDDTPRSALNFFRNTLPKPRLFSPHFFSFDFNLETRNVSLLNNSPNLTKFSISVTVLTAELQATIDLPPGGAAHFGYVKFAGAVLFAPLIST